MENNLEHDQTPSYSTSDLVPSCLQRPKIVLSMLRAKDRRTLIALVRIYWLDIGLCNTLIVSFIAEWFENWAKHIMLHPRTELVSVACILIRSCCNVSNDDKAFSITITKQRCTPLTKSTIPATVCTNFKTDISSSYIALSCLNRSHFFSLELRRLDKHWHFCFKLHKIYDKTLRLCNCILWAI